MTKCKVEAVDVGNSKLTLDIEGKKVDVYVDDNHFFFKKWLKKDVVVSAVKKNGVAWLTSIHIDLDGAEECL